MTNKPVISITNLSFSWGKRPVLEEVNLTINQGDFVWIVGPNGGGKTTLLKLLMGLAKPDKGSIEILGRTPKEARRLIGYMPQQIGIDQNFPMSLFEVVLTGRLGMGSPFGRYSTEDKLAATIALKMVGLQEKANEPMAELSGGQQRRMLIARALACEPELLILDEPMANLDAVVEVQVRDLLFELNKKLTVLMVSHDPSLVSQSVESVVCVNRRVAIHSTYAIDAGMMGELYDRPVRLVRHDRDSHKGGKC